MCLCLGVCEFLGEREREIELEIEKSEFARGALVRTIFLY